VPLGNAGKANLSFDFQRRRRYNLRAFSKLKPPAMTAPSKAIDKLRRNIDVIDGEMHDLLMRRVEIVERIGTLKDKAPGALFIRPEREAKILRRLVSRHKGRFPAAVVARIWREILASTTRLQGPFSVAVNAPEKSVGYWDIARDHYGSATRMSLHRLANPVLNAVFDGSVTVGVLPYPAEDDADPWWPKLVGTGDNLVRIIARVPFIENGNGRFEDLSTLAIARTQPGKSGDDVSLFAVEATVGFSRGGIQKAFITAGLPANAIAVWSESRDPVSHLHLVEIAAYIEPDDPRIAAVADSHGEQIIRMTALGGYAMPIGHDMASES
jgi:chorismate mutase-like protein